MIFRIPSVIGIGKHIAARISAWNHTRLASMASFIRHASEESPSAYYFPHESLEHRQRRINERRADPYLEDVRARFFLRARICGLSPQEASEKFGIA